MERSVADLPQEVPPRFVPKDFLAFVTRCREAGICLPSSRIGELEVGQASQWPVGSKARCRYWAGHDSKAKVYWFTYPADMGALTCYLPPERVPEVTVPEVGNDCPGCRKEYARMERLIAEHRAKV